MRSAGRSGPSWTERIDALLTHPVAGFVIFAVVMLVVFEALFSWSEPLIGAVEQGVAWTQTWLGGAMPAGPLRDLTVDGIVAGVGNVIVFVPQIGLLFLFIGILEDTGYLARVAFVIDRLMAGVGLHGRAFVPLLSGFACAVPAVMATRTIENRRDRLVTMLALPLMSCSARLPVYVLVIATVFAGQGHVLGFLSVGAVALFAMYMLSVVASLTAAAVMRRTVLKGPRPTFVLELPPYRMPLARNLLSSTWQRVRAFLVDAGTIIMAMTVVLWALLAYPKSDAVAHRFAERRAQTVQTVPASQRKAALQRLDDQEAAAQLEHSAAGAVGHAMEPVLKPLGFDWRLGIGILGAFAAREVFVSTLGIVFGIGQTDESSRPLRAALHDARLPERASPHDAPDRARADGLLRARVPVHEHHRRRATRVGVVEVAGVHVRVHERPGVRGRVSRAPGWAPPGPGRRMMAQQIGVVLVVLAAVGYIVWKLTGSHRPRRRRRGPDVPASRLVRGSRSGTGHGLGAGAGAATADHSRARRGPAGGSPLGSRGPRTYVGDGRSRVGKESHREAVEIPYP